MPVWLKTRRIFSGLERALGGGPAGVGAGLDRVVSPDRIKAVLIGAMAEAYRPGA